MMHKLSQHRVIIVYAVALVGVLIGLCQFCLTSSYTLMAFSLCFQVFLQNLGIHFGPGGVNSYCPDLPQGNVIIG